MDFLAEQQIGIESCLTSNIQTSTVADLAAHPLKTFLEHGIRASINTDDPGVQGVDIIHEYTVAAPAAGLSREQIRQAQINGLEMAFLSAEENAHCEKSRREVTKWMVLIAPSLSRKAQSRAMFGGFDAQLNQLHYLDCLTCRNRIFTIAI